MRFLSSPFTLLRRSYMSWSHRGLHRVKGEQNRKIHIVTNQLLLFFITQLVIVIAGINVIHMFAVYWPHLQIGMPSNLSQYYFIYITPPLLCLAGFIVLFYLHLSTTSKNRVIFAASALLLGQVFLSCYVLFLGMDGGFHFYFYVVAPLPFFGLAGRQRRLMFMAVSMLLTIELGTLLALQFTGPLFPLPRPTNTLLYYLIAVFGLLGVTYAAYAMWNQTDRAETRMLKARGRIRSQAMRLSEMNEDLTRKDEAMQLELKLAARAQSAVMPPLQGSLGHVHYHCLYKPVQQVSGDYFDCLQHGNSTFFLMADISGHGVPAALFSMLAHHTFTTSITADESPAEIMRRSNRRLIELIKTDDFITAFLIKVDHYSLSYCNAGHTRAVLLPADETAPLELLDSPGLPLGSLEEADRYYETGSREVKQGDSLLLYTDALTEQSGHSGMWEEEQLLAELQQRRGRLKEDRLKFLTGLHSAWENHRRGFEQADDLTLLLLQFD